LSLLGEPRLAHSTPKESSVRIAIAEVGQETSSFSPVPTTLDTFRQYGLYTGEEVVRERSEGTGAIAGLFAAARAADLSFTPLPIVSAWAGASGALTPGTLGHFRRHVTTGLERLLPIDGFFFSLHGAAAAQNEPDVEGALLEAARAVLGTSVPIVVPYDHHANVTRRMMSHATAMVAHRTQPHDPFDTGVHAAHLLFAILQQRVRPTLAWHKIPMIAHQEQFLTSQGPMQRWFDRARAMEQMPGVLSVSPFPMQPWLDVPEGGWATVVVTDNDPALAQRLSAELAQMAWDLRDDFWVFSSIPAAEAVRRAETADSGLTILSDHGDSVFGGATGDSTVILREMLAQRIQSTALVPLVDAAAAQAAFAAGVGSELTLELGGKLDPHFGRPLPLTVTVQQVAEGVLEAPVIGRSSFDMGKTALLTAGPIHIVVSEHVGVGGNHPIVYRRFGLEPAQARMVVLKTASNFQYYADFAREILRVDTVGPTMSHLEQLPWQRLPRPIYPLDALTVWSATG
jgi:microcystin degradation protein MlrC